MEETPSVVEETKPVELYKVPAKEKPAKVIFEPNPGPQTDFLASSEQEVLFGGAAGGGKSVAMVADPMRYFDNPDFKGLLLRRTMPELRELISISQKMYKGIWGDDAKWTERDSTWRLPSGATLWLSYLEQEKDIDKYYGQAYSWIGFDELTHWESPIYWNMLASRLRTSKSSGLPLCMRASTNPGSRGHSWVKKMFIDPAPYNTPFWARDVETGETLLWPSSSTFAQSNGLVGKPMFKRKFVPSKLSDNPYLSEDGRYEANLLSLPEHKRKQLLEGDWDVAEGAAFSEWNRNIHVVEPFEIPENWTKFRACDYGYGSNSGVLWFAVSPEEQLIVYRELYTHRVLATDLADMILEAEYGERIRYGVLDSSLWHQRGDRGPSLAEQMIMRGCKWRPADRSKGSRVSGKNEVHRRLQVDEWTGQPRMVVFSTCTNLISQLPSLPLDKKNPEDVDTDVEDHLYDALRYGVMSRPRSSVWDFNELYSVPYEPVDRVFGY